ncbi:MAG: 4-phosphopantoate--beta-alanine ligase [Methanobacterium sp.]
MVSPDHPRYNSLLLREKIINAYQSGILAEAGMIAHGRGEAFDYLIGEKTTETADKSIETAAAALLLAKNPVLSVNGNTAALVSDEIIELANVLNAKIEINLFYRTPERVNAILKLLNEKGAREVLGTDDLIHIKGINHPRGDVSSEGIYNADVVLVPLEDGDRTEKLIESGKLVIAIDLNPISRTSKKASITIVDNITRAIPILIKKALEFKDMNENELQNKLNNFNNDVNLKESLSVMLDSINRI